MADDSPSLLYGELIVLGYNGSQSVYRDRQQRRPLNRFTLKRRDAPNGVRRSRQTSVQIAKSSRPYMDPARHSIAFTLSRNEAVVVEYKPDQNLDMFQIGRSSDEQIDFTVVDTWLGVSRDEELPSSRLQSSISRYACRLIAHRSLTEDDVISNSENDLTTTSDSPAIRVFAAGFNDTRNIFLGERATKWKSGTGEIDGLTTNGVLILHPSETESDESYCWREVSVGGDIYTVREARSAQARGEQCDGEFNTLTDGTLIDLCGATMLFRSAEGLSKAPTLKKLDARVDELNASKPQCPVNFNTLVIPRGRAAPTQKERMPFVYLACGHVQGRHSWGHKENRHVCPLCQTESSDVKEISMGMEPSFHLDSTRPDHAFNPCCHMASLKTVRYWSRIPMPQGSSSFHTVCPFCLTTLNQDKPYLRLIFQDFVDGTDFDQ